MVTKNEQLFCKELTALLNKYKVKIIVNRQHNIPYFKGTDIDAHFTGLINVDSNN